MPCKKPSQEGGLCESCRRSGRGEAQGPRGVFRVRVTEVGWLGIEGGCGTGVVGLEGVGKKGR